MLFSVENHFCVFKITAFYISSRKKFQLFCWKFKTIATLKNSHVFIGRKKVIDCLKKREITMNLNKIVAKYTKLYSGIPT